MSEQTYILERYILVHWILEWVEALDSFFVNEMAIDLIARIWYYHMMYRADVPSLTKHLR